MLQSTGTPPHLSVGDLLRLSLTSVWSDVRRHRLLPTRRARRDQRRFSTVCGVTRLTDCASLLFPLHMSHTPHKSVYLLPCPVRTPPPNTQSPPPCARARALLPTQFSQFSPPASPPTFDLTLRKCPTSTSNISATRASYDMPFWLRESLIAELSHRASRMSPPSLRYHRHVAGNLSFFNCNTRLSRLFPTLPALFSATVCEFDHDAPRTQEPQTSTCIPRTLRLKSQSSCRDIVCRSLSEILVLGFIPS